MGGWWWLRSILVFSLSLDQAEQYYSWISIPAPVSVLSVCLSNLHGIVTIIVKSKIILWIQLDPDGSPMKADGSQLDLMDPADIP